jgi:hypothetical protein
MLVIKFRDTKNDILEAQLAVYALRREVNKGHNVVKAKDIL